MSGAGVDIRQENRRQPGEVKKAKDRKPSSSQLQVAVCRSDKTARKAGQAQNWIPLQRQEWRLLRLLERRPERTLFRGREQMLLRARAQAPLRQQGR